MKIVILTVLLVSILPSCFSQTWTIFGNVKDSTTGEALSATSIRVVGTPRGTIANVNGEYRLSLAQGDYALAFIFIGYHTDTIRVSVTRNLEIDMRLTPSPVQLAEVEIVGEDPAVAIMRKVIANKQKWMDTLHTYQFEAFTRETIRKDTAIASIMESYTTGYWQKGDTLREIVKQKRQTQNIPGTENFAAVGGIENFYDDDVQFGAYAFVGPTSHEAFEYYNFTLEKTRHQQGTDIFVIKITPKTRTTPLFRGSICVSDESFALVGVEVSPNEAYSIPFVNNIQLTYSQQFALMENRYWMPVDIRIKGTLEIGVMGLDFPKIGIEASSSIFEYRINEPLPDTIFQKPLLITAKEAERLDSTFWIQHEVLPLTSEEDSAYHKLDSTQTLEKQFKPTGVLATLGDLTNSFLRYIDLRFNRVEGLFVGGTIDQDSSFHRVKFSASLGYGISDKKPKGHFSAEYFMNENQTTSLTVRLMRSISQMPDKETYAEFALGPSALLYKDDYLDYFYSSGWEVMIRTKPMSQVLTEIGVRSVSERNAFQNSDFSLSNRDRHYRPNPSIKEGMLRSLTTKVRYGNDPVPMNIIATNYAEIEVECSDKSLLPSHSSFVRAGFKTEYHFKTFLRRNMFAPTLTFKIVAGTLNGDLPPQRIFALESPQSGLAGLGSLRGITINEFAGDQHVTFSLEHNIRSIPFLLLNIPFLYKNNIEIITFANCARAWASSSVPIIYNHPTTGWYSEAGIGISRVLGLLRLDITRRFTPPSGWAWTLGIATIL
jgi:hypothetical protein